MIVTDNLERCDLCFKIVSVEYQVNGTCMACCEKLEITSCAACGRLFKWSDLDKNYECPAERK